MRELAKLGILDLYIEERWGRDHLTPDNIDGYYMVNWVTDENDNLINIVQQQEYYTSLYYLIINSNLNIFNNYHPLIRNYLHVLEDPNYHTIKIIDTYLLPTGEMIGIPRGNFWLKIIQRRIKNWYAKRIKFLKDYKNLMHREINGKYPKVKQYV